ncbi:MAG: SUMF1/EgtB/PvdO family nonheme iron enzyme, partial [Candidatus Peribacteraceae bacterium]|nr:SUMF1/EgtB/PvdO family nonheme iron enzyme [Candidatus Peribacteraceae bacterium]
MVKNYSRMLLKKFKILNIFGMKFITFLIIFYLLTLSVLPLELKYLGRSGEFYHLKNLSRIKFQENIEGFFATEIEYKGKIVYPKIARFRIVNVKEESVFAQVLEWGEGWNDKDIKTAFINDQSINDSVEIFERINDGINCYKKGNLDTARATFFKILQRAPENKLVLDWINKINKEEMDQNRNESLSKDLIKKMNFPENFQYLLNKTQKVYLNNKSFWEAVFLNDIVMIFIPAGEFKMGNDYHDEDEEPEHKVYLSGFWISKYEISFAKFDLFCKETHSEYPDDEDLRRGNYPVYNVTWYDAIKYCRWLSKKTGLNFTLPTEAHWEKAAGGTDKRKYPWGNHLSFFNKKSFANSSHEADGYLNYAPINTFTDGGSPYGVINMSGNVAEWTGDWY